MLIKNYYTILDRCTDSSAEVFRVSLNKDCDVYRGHFPEKPVCPGVCNLQMIVECASLVAGAGLRIGSIKQCRLTTLVTPVDYPVVEVSVTLLPSDDGSYHLEAAIGQAADVYLSLKAELLKLDAIAND